MMVINTAYQQEYYPLQYGFGDVEGSGGGGCFPEDTMVLTNKGWKPIQKLRMHDVIIGYDVSGSLGYGAVSERFVHERNENPTGLYEFTYVDRDGEEQKLRVTGNHAIYCPGATAQEENLKGKRKKKEQKGKVSVTTWRGERIKMRGNKVIERGEPKKKRPYRPSTLPNFKEAKDFEVGETFTDEKGVKCEITAIKHTPMRKLPKDFKSYNINVVPHHTYIVADRKDILKPQYKGIRVHNGGGGGKGGASRAATEAPNTIATRTTAKIIHLISEGPVVGLTGGPKGIYFNTTPVQAEDGSFNFDRVVFQERTGTPDQEYLPGFPEVESFFDVSTTVLQASPVVYSMSSNDIDAARIIVSLTQGLYEQDPVKGDLVGYQVKFNIETRPSGGTWTAVHQETVQEKTVAPAELVYRVEKPDGATDWDVRVRRVSDDDASSNVRSTIAFGSVTELQDIKVAYENAAVIGISIDAQATGGQIPNVGFNMMGLIVDVPSNYDPILRTYDGLWDGTFKQAFTDNTAWVVYALLTNTRWGLGSYLDSDYIDKWSFYDTAVYNDEYIDDGDSGTEPRFRFNEVINRQSDPWQLIQAIASNCNSVVYPGGFIRLIQDRPGDSVKLINNTNVIDGKIVYTESAIDAIHSAVHITYNNPDNNYLPETLSEVNQDAIDLYGYNPDQKSAFGVTSEGQARRQARWQLDTEWNQTLICTFSTSFYNATVEPGDIIDLIDNERAGGYFSGRITGGTSTSIDLDRSVTLVGGNTYTLLALDKDGKGVIEREVTTSPGTVTTLDFTDALSTDSRAVDGDDLIGRDWHIFSPTQIDRQQYRVLTVKETDVGIFEYTCLSHDPDKYDRVETGVEVADNPFSLFQTQPAGPIDNVFVHSEQIIDPVNGEITNLLVDWDVPVNRTFLAGYKIRWSRDGLPWTDEIFTPVNSYTLTNIVEGLYAFEVRAVINGILS